MCRLFFLLSLFFASLCSAQLQFSEKQIDLGTIPEAYEIGGSIIIKNTSSAKIYLMRADAEYGLKIYTTKKTLLAGDTCLLVISFVPENKGRFNKNISLVSSDQAAPHEITLAGNLVKLNNNDKTACYYFGSKKTNSAPVKEIPAEIPPVEKRDNSNRIPDKSSEPVVTYTPPVQKSTLPETKNPDELSISEYKPNNILFLIDVSGSMKDSLKLPLMKSALHTLINAVREVDRITLVTYADSVKIIREAVSGSDKQTLHAIVDGLKAKGLTKGNKAILFSQQVAQRNFIVGGNNQIFLATDGKFRFYPDDQKTWNDRQSNEKIVMSTVAFGTDREAMKNLKEIADKGDGSFIHIKRRGGNERRLLDEMKERSKIR